MNAQPVISYRSSGREMNPGVASQSSCMMVPSRRPYCRTAVKSLLSLWMDSRILMKHKERACMLSKCPPHTHRRILFSVPCKAPIFDRVLIIDENRVQYDTPKLVRHWFPPLNLCHTAQSNLYSLARSTKSI